MAQSRERQAQGQNRWIEKLKEIGATKEAVTLAIIQGGKSLVKLAEGVGELVQRDGLSASKIRNIYGMVKRMEMGDFNEHEFVLLKPKLAYAAARSEKDDDGPKELKEVLSWAIDAVGQDDAKFRRFVDFFEAILAYHKAAGGDQRRK